MKKLLLFIMASTFTIVTKAQQGPSGITSRPGSYLDSKTIIDSAGNTLQLSKWRELLMTGSYTVKNIPGKQDTMTLVKLTAAEIATREAMMTQPPPSSAFPVGAKMEMFTAKDITGKKINPKELEGKTVVLNFWFIACPPCKAEIPELNKIVAGYSTNPNVVFIAVCLDQSWEIKDFMKQIPFNYMQVADGRSYSDGFNVKSYPTNVVIDPKGIIRFSSSGYGMGTLKFLKKAIEESNKI